jgi:hypothetical protein
MGTVAFVVSLPVHDPEPFYRPGGEALVRDPTTYTFKRPLGRFISCTNSRTSASKLSLKRAPL